MLRKARWWRRDLRICGYWWMRIRTALTTVALHWSCRCLRATIRPNGLTCPPNSTAIPAPSPSPTVMRRFTIGVLCGGPARALSQELEALDSSAARPDGRRRGAHGDQHARRPGSLVWRHYRVCPHAQVRCGHPAHESGEQEIPPQERSVAVYRNRGGHLLCGDDRIRHRHV